MHNERYNKGVQVKYSVRGEDESTCTPMVCQGSCTAQFTHTRIISLSCVVEEHLEYFDTGCITFLVYARQVDLPPDKRLQKMTTRVRIYCHYNIKYKKRICLQYCVRATISHGPYPQHYR